MFNVIKNKSAKLLVGSLLMLSMILTVTIGWAGTVDAEALELEKTVAQFPESYQPYIRELKSNHPNWEFIPVYTKLKWEDVLGSDAEMKLSTNLVPYGATIWFNGRNIPNGSNWKGVFDGAFNWEINDWVKFDKGAGGWVQASRQAVAYVMDPRNWLTEDNIFAFEVLSYNSDYQTYDVLKAMMDDTFMDCDYATVGGTNGKTYAQVLLEEGQKNSVSPVHLCARIIQEKGIGTYNSNTGKYELTDTLASGVVGTDGVIYYNFFNIGASDGGAGIIANGTAEAQQNGWDSQYKAIAGGASKIASSKIKIGQDTIYFQKFNVVCNGKYNVDGNVLNVKYYNNQYMQNLFAPVNEGYNTRIAYNKRGLLKSSFTFKIPVYDDMPDTLCPSPQGGGNPNYKLSSISIKGVDLNGNTNKITLSPSFQMDQTSYSIVVPYETKSVVISASAYASSTSKISGTGTFNLDVGTHTYTVTCTAENGEKRDYNIVIIRKDGNFLKSLSVVGGVMETQFSKELLEYNVFVPNESDSVTFTCATEISGTTVKYRINDISGTVENGQVVVRDLKEGQNILYLDLYSSDNSQKVRTYEINIIKYTKSSFDFSKYQIEGGTDDLSIYERYINGFNIGDSVSVVRSTINPQNGSVKVYKSNGIEKSNGDLIGTGDLIATYDGNGKNINNLRVILYGDVTGDGKVELHDFVAMRKQILKGDGIEGVYLKAADVYPEKAGLELHDIVLLRKYILKGGDISQTR